MRAEPRVAGRKKRNLRQMLPFARLHPLGHLFNGAALWRCTRRSEDLCGLMRWNGRRRYWDARVCP